MLDIDAYDWHEISGVLVLQGVVIAGVECEVDCPIFATGFDVGTECTRDHSDRPFSAPPTSAFRPNSEKRGRDAITDP
jgi:hypothetical protein